MEKEFIPYELAVKLKELGFDEKCLAVYTEGKLYTLNWVNHELITKAPLWQQAFDWFREKHNLSGCVDCLSSEFVQAMPEICEKTFRVHITHTIKSGISSLIEFDSYEEARHACLEKLIELVEKQNI